MVPPPRYEALHNSQGHLNAGIRPSDPPTSPFYKEFDRKPQHPTGPRPNGNLPNILPQFRPNAKISSGHPSHMKHEPGNLRLPTHGMKMPYNPSTQPQFSNRRQPMHQPQLQSRYPMNRISEYDQHVGNPHAPGAVNRRVYRLPPSGGHRVPQLRDRMYARRPTGPLRAIDNYYPVERHAPITPQPLKMNPGDLDYEEEDLVINDPPQAPSKDIQNTNESKLEAVVTLQMLQSQKKPLNGEDTGAGEIQVTAENNPQETLATTAIEQKFKFESEASANEKRDTMLHQDSSAAGTVEYQNTPFSVVREQPQEPILKNKKPQSLQQQAKLQPLHKQKFPYPIEKPDAAYTELQPLRQPVPGVLVAPRIITSSFNTGTEAPIAIAYTPTEPNPFIRNGPMKLDQKLFSGKYGVNEMGPETQTEEVLGNDFDLRGHNFEKNFMAPFYPSVSLGGANSGVSEVANPALSNWKIVQSASSEKVYEKNNINRADVEPSAYKKEKEPENSTDVTTEKHSDLDSFQPQLQGGFKPIFPANYMKSEGEAKHENVELSENDNNKPMALALVRSQTTKPSIISTVTSISSVSSDSSTAPATSSSSSSTTVTTAKMPTAKVDGDVAPVATSTNAPVIKSEPTKHKKSTFETSLAALLFGDDEELEDGARKSPKKENTPARPINVARMGPRSLAFS